MRFITLLLIFLSGSLLTSIITFSILLQQSKTKLKECNQNLYLLKNNENINISETNLLDNYNYFNGMDIYKKFDLLDEYNQQIIIFSKNLQTCSETCNNLKNCDGFSKYNNFCYLKNKFNKSDIEYSPKVNLYKKK